jgi:hypothetical protein
MRIAFYGYTAETSRKKRAESRWFVPNLRFPSWTTTALWSRLRLEKTGMSNLSAIPNGTYLRGHGSTPRSYGRRRLHV